MAEVEVRVPLFFVIPLWADIRSPFTPVAVIEWRAPNGRLVRSWQKIERDHYSRLLKDPEYARGLDRGDC